MPRKISVLLLVSLLVSLICLFSCGDSGSSSKGSGDKASSKFQDSEERLKYDIPEAEDFGGYEFTMLVPSQGGMIVYSTDAIDGEPVNDAVYERNLYLSEKYNITFETKISDDVAGDIRRNVQAGDFIADIAMPFAKDLFPLARENFLVDINTLSNLRLDMPWWDQRIQEDLAINDKLFCINGDYSIRNNMLVGTIQYNKEIYERFDYENPYEMVKNGEWTFDKMWSMVKGVSADLDVDGDLDEHDQWGLVESFTSAYNYFICSGLKPITRTPAGDYEIIMGSERAFDVLNKVLVVSTETNDCILSDIGRLSEGYTTAKNMFMNNQVLFKGGNILDCSALRGMDGEFGILPPPMIYEDQEEYYSLVSYLDAPTVIPTTNKDLDRTTKILEALAFESMFTVREALYDVVLDEKVARDEESKEMLDIVFAAKTYDLDYVTNTTGITEIIYNIGRSGRNNLASQYASIEKGAQRKLEIFINNLDD